MDVKAIQQKLDQFARDRDWDDYHSPKNLAMALGSEVGELIEVFQWMTESESRHISEERRPDVANEIADIIIYALRLADKLGIDVDRAVQDKIQLNAHKYPVELARGNAIKFDKRGD